MASGVLGRLVFFFQGPVQLFNRNVDKCSFAAGPAGSRLWPTQLTHGPVIAFKTNEDGEVSWRMATAMEHLAALGWNVFAPSDAFPLCNLKFAIEHLRLTPGQVKTLTGNSMHLLTQMSFMLYILAQCGRKVAHHSNPPARVSSWDEFSSLLAVRLSLGFHSSCQCRHWNGAWPL